MTETNKPLTDRDIAASLLRIKAVFLSPEEPFTWASGIKSPIYCDNRLILSYPEVRDTVERALAEAINEYFPDREILMGTSTAGIAHAALAAGILGIPMGYVRGKAKDHGRGNRIEGELKKGQKVVVIEDLISTGGSALEAAAAVKEAGGEVLGVMSIFSYGLESGICAFRKADVELRSLTCLDALADEAADGGYIRPDQKTSILRFRDDPENWYAHREEK